MEGIVDEEIDHLREVIYSNLDVVVREIHSTVGKQKSHLEELKDDLRDFHLESTNLNERMVKASLESKCLEDSIHIKKNERKSMEHSLVDLETSLETLKTDISNLSSECERYEEEKNAKVKELKENFESHCMRMNLYKKNLKIYIDISNENSNVFTLYFFKTEKDASEEYSATLKFFENEWQLISLKPSLPIEKQLGKHLKQTKDIQGFLVCVRNHFKKLRESST